MGDDRPDNSTKALDNDVGQHFAPRHLVTRGENQGHGRTEFPAPTVRSLVLRHAREPARSSFMIRIGSSLHWWLNTSTHRRTDQVLRAQHDSARRCRPARALDPRRPRRRRRPAPVASDAGGPHPARLTCPRPRRRTPPCARARAAPGSPGIPAPKHRPTAALRPRAQSTLPRDRHRVADRLEERHVLVAIAVANDRSRSRPCSSASAAPPAPSPPPTTARPPGGRSVTIPVIVR